MVEDGSVSKAVAIEVLRNCGVDVSPQNDGMMILAKGQHVESMYIPEQTGRRLLHYFGRKFDIPIRYFYHPELAKPLASDKIQ